LENLSNALDPWNRLMDERGKLSRAHHVDRAGKRLELPDDVEKTDRLRQQRQLV
jgi:hypothetical protein